MLNSDLVGDAENNREIQVGRGLQKSSDPTSQSLDQVIQGLVKLRHEYFQQGGHYHSPEQTIPIFQSALCMLFFYPGNSLYTFPPVLSPCITVKQEQHLLYKYLLDTRFLDLLNFIIPWQSKHNSFNLSPYAKFPSTMIILFPPKLDPLQVSSAPQNL